MAWLLSQTKDLVIDRLSQRGKKPLIMGAVPFCKVDHTHSNSIHTAMVEFNFIYRIVTSATPGLVLSAQVILNPSGLQFHKEGSHPLSPGVAHQSSHG